MSVADPALHRHGSRSGEARRCTCERAPTRASSNDRPRCALAYDISQNYRSAYSLICSGRSRGVRSPGEVSGERSALTSGVPSQVSSAPRRSRPQGEPDHIGHLLAAHHGKGPFADPFAAQGERWTQANLFARGVWDGDELGEVDLGNGERILRTVLCLDYMRLGGSERVGASWTARMIALRDDPSIGPFRPAFSRRAARAGRRQAREQRNPGSTNGQ